ncbi:hypothetical protein ACFQ1M_00270 [Sungkyunkwania multivorans]|uniref:Uncharacterized protein n=1 Tax=Sungkyunkwania multivorans TaxID=1173618 RepID=A0ABW3CTY5_9FLAO
MMCFKQYILILGCLGLIQCTSKTKSESSNPEQKATYEVDNTEVRPDFPRGKWRVLEAVHPDGNLMQNDSTYILVIQDQNQKELNLDSLMRAYHTFIDASKGRGSLDSIPSIILQDSLFYKRWVKDETLRTIWQEQFYAMQKAMATMDSLRFEFLKKSSGQ